MLTFISYSRKEFYFAEALARDLKVRGIPIWFDAFDISPGGDWEAQIGMGVGTSTICLLVASKNSLTSRYVEKEWRGALDAGRPVVIVAFEAADLPAELRSRPTFDFRSKYEEKLDALVAYLLQGKGRLDAVPKRNAFGLPTALPPAVLLTAGALLLTAWMSTLWIVWFFVELVRHTPLATFEDLVGKLSRQHPTLWAAEVFCIWYGTFLGRACLRFIMRVPDDNIRPLLFFQAPLVLYATPNVLGGILDEWIHGDISRSISEVSLHISPWQLEGWAGWLLFATLAVWALDWTVGFKMRNSLALLRWSPIGLVWERLRARSYRAEVENALPVRQGPTAASGPVAPTGEAGSAIVSRCIQVLASPEDGSVAGAIQSAMTRAGHRLSTPLGQPAEVSLVVLSNRTRVDWLDQVLASSRQRSMVCVAATSIDIPEDRSLVLGRQWVDFRRRRPETLDQLGQTLARSGGVSRPVAAQPAPEALNRPVYPVAVITAGSVIAVVVGQTLGMSTAAGSLSSEQHVPPAIGGGWVLAMGVITSLLGLWLWRSLLTRKASRRAFATAGAIAVLALASLLAVLSTAISVLFKMVRLTGLDAAMPLLQFITPALAFPVVLLACRTWLPDARGSQLHREETLALRHHPIFAWFGIACVVGGLVNASFVVRTAAEVAPVVAKIENQQRLDRYLRNLNAEIVRLPRLQELMREIDREIGAPAPLGSNPVVDFLYRDLYRDLRRQQLTKTIALSGWLMATPEVLDRHARLSLKLLGRMDTETCADVARAQMQSVEPTKSLGKILVTLESIDDKAIDEFIYIQVQVLSAGVSGAPAAVIDIDHLHAALEQIAQGLSAKDANRYHSILLGERGNVSDEDACWFARTLFREVGRLTPEDRALVLRAVATSAFTP